MTEKQRTLYFRLWWRAAKLNDWPRFQDEPGELPALVESFAARIAAQHRRAPTLDDFRHGANCVAFGRDKSANDLTNPEVDRIFALFKLLIDPDDLSARMTWDHPEIGDAKRLDWFIRHAAPEAYTREVAADRFGTRNWEGLLEASKRQLAMTLANRRRKKSTPLPSPLSPIPF